MTAVTRIMMTVLPVISFMATMVAWTVTFPFIARVENCCASYDPLPVDLGQRIFPVGKQWLQE